MLIFATGNKKKIAEASDILNEFRIRFEAKNAEVDEIQHHDPLEITRRKALDMYNKLTPEFGDKLKIVVHDTSWDIPALNGFPGGYMKDVLTWFSVDDFLNLMDGKKDRSAIEKDNIVYYDGEIMKVFSHNIPCVILTKPRGKCLSSWEKVCSSDGGNHSLAENWENNFTPTDDLKKQWQQHWIDFAN